ncbi:MAG: ureidoglycolate lyase [Candidatus Vecturithrix sp.]|jgi:ureidoglycolate lyase|nr:ureidoglycolate lyase [Candidatus Vecturithrix sp.]
MLKKPVQDLSQEKFSKYGTFVNMLNPQTVKIGAPPIEFFRDMAQLQLGCQAAPSFSICRVEKRPLIVDTSEYHNHCGEGTLPLDGDILIHVAPATAGELNTEDIEIFRVPQGTFVTLRPGVWHHAAFTWNTDSVNVLIVLAERTYATDCYVHEIPAAQRVAIDS